MKFIDEAFSFLKDSFLKENENRILWLPFFYALGIICYFAINFEPNIRYVFASIIIIFLAIIYFKHDTKIKLCLSVLCIFSTGFLVANLKAVQMNSPVLQKEIGAKKVKAILKDIQTKEFGKRFIIEIIDIDGLKKSKTPKNVRVNINTDDNNAEIGDKISVLASLRPPPKPVIKHGYDFARYAYFKEIGAIGYSLSGVEILKKSSDFNIFREIKQIRQKITDKILDAHPNSKGNIATALLVGQRGGIDKNDLEAMRTAGLSHLLAISGMHIALVASMFFFTTRLLLSLMQNIALKYNIKKMAVISAIAGSLTYLLISGYPISAQRAFIMSSIFLLAIYLNRTGTPLRSVALALVIILTISPESILTPGFQMSFASVTSLICIYSIFYKKDKILTKPNIITKSFYYILGIITASLIAAIATAPFSIYHFNHFSSYGILSNFVAVPLTSFVIMPLGVISLIFMPVGLQELPLSLMIKAIEIIVQLSHFIAKFPASSASAISLPTYSFAIIVLCTLWFFIWQQKWRYFSLAPLILVVLFVLIQDNKPNVIINSDGELFAVKNADGGFAFSNISKNKYTQKMWLAKYGVVVKDLINSDYSKNTKCDFYGCVVKEKGYEILVAKHAQALLDNCDRYDMIINLSFIKDVCKNEGTIIVNRWDLKKMGTHSVFLKERIDIETVFNDKKRLWQN